VRESSKVKVKGTGTRRAEELKRLDRDAQEVRREGQRKELAAKTRDFETSKP
jgi:hypothetical protein